MSKNTVEILRIENKLAEVKYKLAKDVSNRNYILETINNVCQDDEFDVKDVRMAIESISTLKTNSLTLLTKEIYNLQTYRNQLLVEDMKEEQKMEMERFANRENK